MSDPRTNGTDEELGADEQVRRAARGDAESWLWIVEHYSPLLEVQARYRLGARLRCLYDPCDLVNDVWLIAYRRLPGIEWPASGAAGMLLRFLGTTLVFRVNELLRKNLRYGGREKDLARRAHVPGSASVHGLRNSTLSACSRAALEERARLVRERLERLRPEEREILVLRGLEGLSNAHLAARTGAGESALSMRYCRALAKLKSVLPSALHEDLART